MPLTPYQVVVMEGGLRWLCMAALSLCLFDIWPECTARMKEQAPKKEREWKESERLDGCVYFMFGRIYNGYKKKEK